MSAEMVIRENLEMTLNNPRVILKPSLQEKLNMLGEQVRRSQGAVVPLEGRDHIHGIPMRVQLEKLLTSLHQADDLLDQILTFERCSRLRRGVQEGNGHGNWRQLVRQVSRCAQEVSIFLSLSNQLVFQKKMARQVEKISHEMGTLVGQLRNEHDNNNPPVQNEFQQIVWDRSAKNSLIGRDDDKNNIVKMLLQSPKSGTSNVSIIHMSGVPGVGKSALANDIYEDQRVKSHFDLRMLVPVSQINDATEIVRETVEICTNRRSSYSDNTQSAHYHNGRVGQNDTIPFRGILGCRSSSILIGPPKKSDPQNAIDIFERRLRKEIKGKLYLLILDDCCLVRWQSLRKLLAGGAKGSKILVTTQSPEVADLVNSENLEVKHYPLSGLSKDHSWALFRTLALEQTGPSGEMKKIGSEIANICQHLPLTIKIAARFLHGKTADKWSNFKRELRSIHYLEGDVMDQVLRLSLSDLPIRLRACFEYCSLFPDDFIFNKHDLISLWIAQGFVNPDEAQSLEKTGDMYFMELSRRCLFEEVSTDELGNILTCKMHHIVCRLASKFTATGGSNILTSTSSMISSSNATPKHVSVNWRGSSSLKLSPPSLEGPSLLRTLIFIKEPDCDKKMESFVCNQLISSYKRLRVLDLHDLGLKELPDSIGEQTHLRYLDLSKNDDLVTLPKSFDNLYNLQTLKLNSCAKLEPLSIDFGLLVNLKRFEVDGCESLTCMPFGLEKLSQLETLSRFVVGKESSRQTASVGLEELSKLTMLRGRLVIEFLGDCWLPNTREDDQVELPRNGLKNMSELCEVQIRWAKWSSDVEVQPDKEAEAQKAILERQKQILELLQPNENLKILCIEGYKGGDFPSWANIETISSSLPNLVIISIEGCGTCEYLPPFGELVHLKKLTLRHMTNVLYVENPAARNEGAVQNRSLFISLEELTLHNFYKLQGWRREVALVEQAETRSFPCLFKLRIWNCPNLISLPSFPKVKDLKLRNVNQLLLDDCARKASTITESLKIKGFPDLAGFDVVRKGLGGLPSLKHLVIDRCDSLSSLVSDLNNLNSLVSLRISSCKELDLSLDSHSTFRNFRSPTWKNLKNLRELTLIEIPKMKTLPEGLKHVQTLKMLWISACQSLGSLPEWISNLTSLQHLRIESCHALQRLPAGLKKVTSLLKVEITECPELMERCREHKGEDWPYIKHARVLLHKSWRYGYVSQESHAHSFDTNQVDAVPESLPQQLVSIVFNTINYR